MYSKLFWADALERMVATGCQAVLIAMAGQQLDYVISGWAVVTKAFAAGAVLALIKALAAMRTGTGSSASFVVDAAPRG